MTIDRRNFVTLGALLSAGVLAGCAGAEKNKLWTSALFENEQYTENVSSVLVSEDDKYIVVVTEKYHYVFGAPPELVAALKAPFHHAITGSPGRLHVNSSGAATIDYHLRLNNEATQEEKDQARAAGFQTIDEGVEFFHRGELRGTRYLANGVHLPAQSPVMLNRTYYINVDAELPPDEKSRRALLTPVTVTADGAMLLGVAAAAILLFPVTLTMFAILTNPRSAGP